MRLPVLLVSLAICSSVLAGEIPISQPDVVPIDTFVWRASFPVVVAGDGFLVAWQESFGYTGGGVKIRTYGADGTPRQELPVTLGGGLRPRAFWNGSEYVVLYGVSMSKYGYPEPIPAILAKRVRPDGTFVEDSTVTLAMSRSGSRVHGVAFDGVNAHAAVTLGDGTHHQLLLDRNGGVLRDTPLGFIASAVAVRPGGGFFVLPQEQGSDVVAGGDKLAVVAGPYEPSGQVTAAILDSTGTELEGFRITGTGGPLPRIVWDGGAWLAVYSDDGNLCTARFTGAADLIRTCDPRGNVYTPSIALGSNGPFTAWDDRAQIVTQSGIATTTLSSAAVPDAVVDDVGLLTAWIESNAIRIGGIANDGTLRPERRVDAEVQSYNAVRLSRAANRTLLVWWQYGNLYGMHVDGNVRIRLGDGSTPAVAARGDEWVVVSSWAGAIQAIHLSKDVNVTARETFAGTASQDSPAIAATSTGYLVAWIEAENGIARIVVEPLDARGRRFTGGNRIVENNGPLAYPNVACNTAACLVTWQGDYRMGLALVRHDGTRISEDRFFPISAVTRDVAIKVEGDGSFVVYRGNTFTPVSAEGVPGRTVVWHNQPVGLGNVVTWQGRTTAVYARASGGTGRIFAYQFTPRVRAVRP